MSHDIKRAQTYIVNAVFAVHHGRNGDDGVGVVKDAAADVAHGDGDGVERRAR